MIFVNEELLNKHFQEHQHLAVGTEERCDGKQDSEGPVVQANLHVPRGSRVRHRPRADGSYACNRCDDIFPSVETLASHIKEHILEASAKRRENDKQLAESVAQVPRQSSRLQQKCGRPQRQDDIYVRSFPKKQTRLKRKRDGKAHSQYATEKSSKSDEAVQKETNSVDVPDNSQSAQITEISTPGLIMSVSPPHPSVLQELMPDSEETEIMIVNDIDRTDNFEFIANNQITQDQCYPKSITHDGLVQEDLDSSLSDVVLDQKEAGKGDVISAQATAANSVTFSQCSLETVQQKLEGSEPQATELGNQPNEPDEPKSNDGNNQGSQSLPQQKSPLKGEAILDNKRQMYNCRSCRSERQFVSMTELKDHLLGHMQLKRCSKCDKVNLIDRPHNCERMSDSPNQAQAKNTNKSEAQAYVYTCHVCQRVFDKESLLKRHASMHSTEEKHQCVRCERKFVKKKSLEKHMTQCTGNSEEEKQSHYCEFCGALFTREEYLLRHMASHTGKFSCEKCGRKFCRKESLLRHWAICMPDEVKSGKKSVFPCELCSRAFGKELSLQNHMAVHKGLFTCDQCNKAFTQKWSLENHKCQATSETTDIACPHCPKRFSQHASLQRHLVVHRNKHVCAICNTSFSRKGEMLRHVTDCSAGITPGTTGEIICAVCGLTCPDRHSYRSHYKDHLHPYKCDQCGKVFMRETSLQNHVCAGSKNQVRCPVCLRNFKDLTTLQRHKSIHDKPRYPCDRCEKSFNRIDFYNTHVCLDSEGNSVPVEQKTKTDFHPPDSHVCPICGKVFGSVSNLNKHIVCHGEKKEKCHICGKLFHLKVALREHMTYVHTEVLKVECPKCGKRLKSRNSLYPHMKQFHSDTVEVYPCKECGKKFNQKGNLTKHMLTHSDKRKYTCRFCYKKFKFPEQIRRHELWHTEGHRFKCDLCDKAFVMEFEIKKHMNTSHGGSTYICCYCNADCQHFHSMKRHLMRRHFDIKEWQADTNNFVRTLLVNKEAEEPKVKKEHPSRRSAKQLGSQPSTQISEASTSSTMFYPTASGLTICDMDESLSVSPLKVAQSSVLAQALLQGIKPSGIETEPSLDQLTLSQTIPSTSGMDFYTTIPSLSAADDDGSEAGNVKSKPLILYEIEELGMDGDSTQELNKLPQVIIQNDGKPNIVEKMNGDLSPSLAQALQSLSTHIAMDAADQQQTMIIGDIHPIQYRDSVPVTMSDLNRDKAEFIVLPMLQEDQLGSDTLTNPDTENSETSLPDRKSSHGCQESGE